MFNISENVALNGVASQLNALNFFGFLWTADKAIDGCREAANSDTTRCCSCSDPFTAPLGGVNFWRVDFTTPQSIMRVLIVGRSGNSSLSLILIV